MDFLDNIQALGTAAQTFMMTHGSSLEATLQRHLLDALAAPSPVDRIVKAAEALYAARDTLNDDGKALCAQLMSHAALQGWHGLAEDNRGGRIVQAMCRDLGEPAPTGEWPAPETDPAPDSRYVPAEEMAIAIPAATGPVDPDDLIEP